MRCLRLFYYLCITINIATNHMMEMKTVYDFSVKDRKGATVSLKVVMSTK